MHEPCDPLKSDGDRPVTAGTVIVSTIGDAQPNRDVATQTSAWVVEVTWTDTLPGDCGLALATLASTVVEVPDDGRHEARVDAEALTLARVAFARLLPSQLAVDVGLRGGTRRFRVVRRVRATVPADVVERAA